MDTLWINGEFMPLKDGKVSVEDRAHLFGDGIYEVIAAYKGVPVLMDEHLDRWEQSAAGLGLESPYNREQRRGVIMELVRRFGASRISIYGQLSRGTAKRAHQFPVKARASEFWYVQELPRYPETMHADGVAVVTHPDERWARCWIKSTSLLANCLAKQYAVEHGAVEAILYREDGTVTEGAIANFHVVKDGVVYTHPLDGRILGGVKRALMIRVGGQIGVTIKEQKYDLEFLKNADEAFLTSTTINVMPVTKCDGKPVGDGRPGPITQLLMEGVHKELAERYGEPASV